MENSMKGMTNHNLNMKESDQRAMSDETTIKVSKELRKRINKIKVDSDFSSQEEVIEWYLNNCSGPERG